jgi:hypothetical protein
MLDRGIPLGGEKTHLFRIGAGDAVLQPIDLLLYVVHFFLHSFGGLGRGCAPPLVDPRQELTGERVREALRLLRTGAVCRDPEESGPLVGGGGDASSEVDWIPFVVEPAGDASRHLAERREDGEGREIRDIWIRRSEDRGRGLEPPSRRRADRSGEPCAQHAQGNGGNDDEPAAAESS